MSREPDKHLVHHVLSGDRQACAELVRRHHAEVFRFCFHLCRDQHDAEDLSQETFASCWRGLGSFRGSASLATWLHRIAYNKFIDWRRKRDRLGPAEVTPFPERCANSPGAIEAVVAHEQNARLLEAVTALGEPERVGVVLHYFQGLSLRQTAQVLCEPVGTVKWRINKALTNLRQLLKD